MKWLVMVLLLCVATSTLASWERSEADPVGDDVYFEPASIRRHGNIVRMRVLMDGKKAASVEAEQYRSIKAEIEFECVQSQMRVYFLSLHTQKMGGGNIVRFGPVDNDWRLVEAGGNSVALLEQACRRR